MASTDEQSSGLLSWHAARQPEMNQQIFAGIVGNVSKGFLYLDLYFATNEQPDAEIQRDKHRTWQQPFSAV